MSLLSVQNLTCSQGAKTLFEKVSFGIEEGEKVALIGVNGCGKSTLLSEIMTAKKSSNIVTRQGLKITFLPQLPSFNPEDSILEHLFRADTPTAKVIQAYHRCLEDPDNSPPLDTLNTQMDLHNAWDYEVRVTSILSELNIHSLTQKMKTLSGGMIKKISLAQCFFEESDLLILDEPTNHLDIETITWLEDTLKRMHCTLLMVTHDRYFLDKICTKIIEIDQKTIFTYRGNYQAFLEQKDQRLTSQQKTEESIQGIMRVELAWLRRGPKARSTKQKARKQRIEVMQDRDVYQEQEAIELGVSGRRLGKKILELKDVSKSFGDRPIIKDFSYTFKQGEKIGVLGPNGTGKTTLFNLVSNRLQPDSGEVDCGVNTIFGYFDQHSKQTDPSQTLYEHVTQIGQFIELHDGTKLSATKLLEKFLFPSSALKTKLGDLSGGEKRRLDLVCLLLTNPNFLLFDEPTNDLDISTLSILEDFLLNFAGCVMVISHDRYFMDRVVDQLLVFNEKGRISYFAGGYTDYADLQIELEKEKSRDQRFTKQDSTSPSDKKESNKSIQQERKKLESEIEKLEDEVKAINRQLGIGNPTPVDYETAGKRLKEIEVVLAGKYARWEAIA